MEIYRFVLAHCPEIVATVGLAMDIVGIWLLFLFGGLGGHPVEMPMDRLQPWRCYYPGSHPEDRRMQWLSFSGLFLASAGFALQAVAQWLQ